MIGGDGRERETWRELESLVGVEESRASMVAHDPVSEAEIRLWCDAIGDQNPVYRDPEVAARSAHGGLVAPPAMLQVWTLPPLDVSLPPFSLPPADLVDSPGNRVYTLMDRLGFTSLIATNTDQEYHRYLRPGDVLSATTTIESISPLKKTALGDGHFVTSLQTNRDQHGDTVATLRLRILKFRPKSPDLPRPAPVVTPDNSFFWAGVAERKLLVQACSTCGSVRHPPRPMCPTCHSLEWQPVPLSGEGSVFSYVVIPTGDGGGDVVALVELERGIRMVAGLACQPEGAAIAMGVELGFVERTGFTLPRFYPVGTSPVPPPPRSVPEHRPALVRSGWQSVRFASLAVGDLLPEWEFTATPTMIVAGAILSRNYRDVHHASDRAQARGSRDIFMSITTTGGHVARYVTDWAGPEAIVRSMALQLGAPNYPYDEVKYTGEVAAMREADGRHLVDVAVRARNGLGEHVSATVRVELGRDRLG